MTSWHLRSMALLVVLSVPTDGFGQGGENESIQTSVQIAPAGVRRYEPGTWSSLAINATNKTRSDTNEYVAIFIGEDSHLQFARRFWLPTGSRRQTFVPIFIPATSPQNPTQIAKNSPQIDAFLMRIKETAGAESFEGDPRDTHIADQPLLLDYLQTKTGLLFHRGTEDEQDGTQQMDLAAYDTVHSARSAVTDSRVLIDFASDFIPPYPSALDALDQMVISGDRILHDSVGLANLRHWLQRGGRIWIMLDTTSMQTVTALLGDETRCTVVDRVELNAYAMEDLVTQHGATEKPKVASWTTERPVDMVRVFAGTDDIHCQIGDWPAAFWQRVGDGEVLFTTLGPRGWLENGEATPALVSVARRFFQAREAATLEPDIVGPLLNDQIGYRIPSRGLAFWILGLNSLAILSMGCWWARTHQLERLAWFIPTVALVASGAFLIIGSRNTVAVPSTVAIGQVVRVSNASQESHIAGISAVYSQDSVELDLSAENGALATVLNYDERGTIRRIVWDDSGRSRWVNVQQPSGVVRLINSQRTVTHGPPRVVRGTFAATGFRGTLSGIEASTCEDAIVAMAPAQAAAVSLDATGAFAIAAGDVLAPGQYIADGLLSDKQRSRQRMMRELLATSEGNLFGAEPSLLVWTPLMDMGVGFHSNFEQTGSALLSLPLEIDRPAAGVDVHILAPFIKIQSFAGRQGASSVFNQRTGAWLENATKPTRTQVRCLVPKVLLPLQLDQATVTIKINAPSRRLMIEGLVADQTTVLYEKANPNGVLRIELDRPEALELDADGGLHLSVVVTETDAELAERDGLAGSRRARDENSTWQIDYLRVDVAGTVR